MSDLKFPWRGAGMITARQFADHAQCTLKVVHGMIDRGEILAIRFGRHHRIPRAEAFRFFGVEDPEGFEPPSPSRPRRARLSPDLEAAIHSFAAR